MLTIKRLGTCSSGAKIAYYTEIASIEYYENSYEPHGIWFGNFASQMKLLDKSVTHSDLLNLAQGLSIDGNELVENSGKDHWIGQDLTFSAPKSVSVLFGLSDEEDRDKIQQAHLNAIKKVLKYAEKNIIETRTGFDEFKNRERVISNKSLFAIFQHCSSRMLDVNLHSHCLLINLTHVDGVGVRCIESLKLHKYQKALGVMYRNELSYQLNKNLNVNIQKDNEFFKLPLVPDELCQLFSKRSEVITESIAKNALLNNPASRSKVALYTRENKVHLPRETLFKNWAIEAEGWKPKYPDVRREHNLTINDYKDDIFKELVEYQSVFQHKDLLEVVNKYSQWLGLGVDAAIKYIEILEQDAELVKIYKPNIGMCYTTQHQLDLENEFYTNASTYSKLKSHSFFNDKSPAIQLSDEQKSALDGVTSGGALIAINGLPGTGKSYLMRELNSLYLAKGYKLIGACIAAKASESLQESSGIDSKTLDSILLKLDNGSFKLTNKTVIVLDEAGMCGVQQLNSLMEHSISAGSKLLLVGDYNQLTPVRAGNPYYRLIKLIPTFELNNIQRQTEQVDRNNVLKIKAGDVESVFHDLEKRGNLCFKKDHFASKGQLVNDWYEKYKNNPNENFMVASTKEDVAHLNKLARYKLQLDQALTGIPVQLLNYENQVLDIQQNERVMFRKNAYAIGVANGSVGNVKSITKWIDRSVNVVVVLDNGKEVMFNSKYYSAIDYGYGMTTHKSQGLTCDNAFIYFSERYLSKELTYVQMSRSRNAPKVYCSSALMEKTEYIKELSFKAQIEDQKIDAIEFYN
jgi:conjugative relaxase-like TrwC/TraI family protein